MEENPQDEERPDPYPRTLRPAGELTCLGLLGGAIVLGGVVLFLMTASRRAPGQDQYPIVPNLMVGAAVGLLFWYRWGFVMEISAAGIRAIKRPPFSSVAVLWEYLIRVDYYYQQRRLGLGGVAADTGVGLGRIRGFRFWGSTRRPLDFKEYDIRIELAEDLWMTAIRNAVRAAAERDASTTVVVRHGSASSEAHFKGLFSRKIEGIIDLEFDDEGLTLLLLDDEEARIGLEGAGEADHVLIELAIGLPLDANTADSRLGHA